MTTLEKLKVIVAEHASRKPEEVSSEATLESLGMDSLDRVELVMKIEESFDIEINDEQADKLESLSQIAEYIDHLSADDE